MTCRAVTRILDEKESSPIVNLTANLEIPWLEDRRSK